MIDILEFIDELKELQVLYNEGELCNFDFESKIHKFQKQVTDFEQSMQNEFKLLETEAQFMINIPDTVPETVFPSEFRSWCTEKWMEHKDEVYIWEKKFPEYDSTYYFRKHRWMLKKMFQEEKLEEYRIKNEKQIQKAIKRGFKKGNL